MRALACFLFVCVSIVAAEPQPNKPTNAELIASYERASKLAGTASGKVLNATLKVQWSDRAMWYKKDLPEGKKEFIEVDLQKGSKGPAFDHAKLAESLAKATGQKVDAAKLPFDAFDRLEGAIEFSALGAKWKCDTKTYECTKTGDAKPTPKPDAKPDEDDDS
jgi:dipeptidyl-peptidase 4